MSKSKKWIKKESKKISHSRWAVVVVLWLAESAHNWEALPYLQTYFQTILHDYKYQENSEGGTLNKIIKEFV